MPDKHGAPEPPYMLPTPPPSSEQEEKEEFHWSTLDVFAHFGYEYTDVFQIPGDYSIMERGSTGILAMNPYAARKHNADRQRRMIVDYDPDYPLVLYQCIYGKPETTDH